MKISSTSMSYALRDYIAKQTVKQGRIPGDFLQLMTLSARKMVLRRARYYKHHPEEMEEKEVKKTGKDLILNGETE